MQGAWLQAAPWLSAVDLCFPAIPLLESGAPHWQFTNWDWIVQCTGIFYCCFCGTHPTPAPWTRHRSAALHPAPLLRWRGAARCFSPKGPLEMGPSGLRQIREVIWIVASSTLAASWTFFCKPEEIKSNPLHFLWQSFMAAWGSLYWKSLALWRLSEADFH